MNRTEIALDDIYHVRRMRDLLDLRDADGNTVHSGHGAIKTAEIKPQYHGKHIVPVGVNPQLTNGFLLDDNLHIDVRGHVYRPGCSDEYPLDMRVRVVDPDPQN